MGAGKELERESGSVVVEEDKDYVEWDRDVVVKSSVEDLELPVDAIVDFSVRQQIEINMVFVVEFSGELLTRNVLEIRVCTLTLVRASAMAGSVKLQLSANISAALTRSHQVAVELCQRIQNALLLNGTRMVGVIWDQKPVKVKGTIDSICTESEKDQAGKELDAQADQDQDQRKRRSVEKSQKSNTTI